MTRDWRFVATVLNVWTNGEQCMLGLIRGMSPPPGFAQKPLQPDSESTHEAGNSLHDGDEEIGLLLSEMLQETVRSGCALNFGEEP